MRTVDVGNSSVSVGVWEGDRCRVTRCADLEQAVSLLGASAVGIAVSGPRWEALQAALVAAGSEPVRRLQGVPRTLALAAPSLAGSAGSDRLAAALAVGPGPAVVVDAGTAVTVDIVDGAGAYCGGFIAPGPAAGLAGLARATEALPDLPAKAVDLVPGLETQGALSAGAWGLAVGGVDRLVQAALESLSEAAGRQAPARESAAGSRCVELWATGGWGAAWAAASRLEGAEAIQVDPALVHRGVAAWAALP